jgi:D-amino-acid dehydrogenase
MWMEDAPLVLRPRADMAMMRWGLEFLYNCLPERAKRHSEVLWRLGRYSREKMEEIIADTAIDFHYIDKGILHVFSTQKAFDHACEQSRFQESLGCHETILSVSDCFRMEPSLQHSAKKIYGGIHAPIDASGDIHVFTKKLAELCTQRYGTRFDYNVTVDGLVEEAGRIRSVKTSIGDVTADAYVMALGSYSPLYLKQVGIRAPIYPMKGYSVTFDANDATPHISITDAELKIVYSRLGNHIRVAGTAEFAGYNTAIRKARIDPIMRGVNALFPKADLRNTSEWACLRPSTPDGPPIIGTTKLPNLYMNTGHGTLGWTQAAGSARLLADIIEGKTTEISLAGLTLDRY